MNTHEHITAFGHQLVAVEQESCNGCFFDNLCLDGYEGIERVMNEVGTCSGSCRKDGKDVIFIEVNNDLKAD